MYHKIILLALILTGMFNTARAGMLRQLEAERRTPELSRDHEEEDLSYLALGTRILVTRDIKVTPKTSNTPLTGGIVRCFLLHNENISGDIIRAGTEYVILKNQNTIENPISDNLFNSNYDKKRKTYLLTTNKSDQIFCYSLKPYMQYDTDNETVTVTVSDFKRALVNGIAILPPKR